MCDAYFYQFSNCILIRKLSTINGFKHETPEYHQSDGMRYIYTLIHIWNYSNFYDFKGPMEETSSNNCYET